MLQFFHRNKRSVLGFFVALVICLSMALFGAEALLNNQIRSQAAITVDSTEVSFDQFDQQRRMFQQQLIATYGASALAIFPNLGQEVADRIIASTVLENDAKKVGLVIGEDAVRQEITSNFFPSGFQPATYKTFLAQTGFSPQAFEAQVSQDLLRRQYISIVEDLSVPSELETRAAFIRDNTAVSLDYVELNPSAFANDVADPGDEVLREQFELRGTDYELPAKVSYDYVVLNPANYLHLVDLTEDDIELEYSESTREFAVPDSAKVNLIVIRAAGEDAAAIASAKERAEIALAELSAGKSFADVARAHSDDALTKLSGGEVGWITRGTRSAEFDRVVFAAEPGSVTDIISTEKGYEIAQVLEIAKGRTKPLSEVRAQIEERIRKREAPIYLADYAHGLVKQWGADNNTAFVDLLKKEALAPSSTAAMVAKDGDPTPELKGLTAKVLEQPGLTSQQKRAVIELGDKVVLVQINDFKEAHLPAFADSREQVLADYRKSNAAELTRTNAADLLSKAQAGSLKAAASEAKLKVESVSDIKRSAPPPAALRGEQIQRAIFGTAKAGLLPKIIEDSGKFYILDITAIAGPTEEQIAKELPKFGEQYKARSAQQLTQSVLESLRAQAKIDINPGVLAY